MPIYISYTNSKSCITFGTVLILHPTKFRDCPNFTFVKLLAVFPLAEQNGMRANGKPPSKNLTPLGCRLSHAMDRHELFLISGGPNRSTHTRTIDYAGTTSP